MAKSGAFSGSVAAHAYTLWVDWTTQQNVTANTVTLTLDVSLKQTAGSGLNMSAKVVTAYIKGKKYTFTAPAINNTGGVTTKLGTIVSDPITQPDGFAMDVDVSVAYPLYTTLDGTYYTVIQPKTTLHLDEIPIKSIPTLSANQVELGKQLTIYTNSQSDDFQHTVKYNWYSLYNDEPAWITLGTGVATALTWTLPLDFANNLPGRTSGVGTIRVETWLGDTLLGTYDLSFTATVPASMVPVVDINVTDATMYRDMFGGFVQGLSKMTVRVNATPAYGSPIKTYNVRANGENYSAPNFTTSLLQQAGTASVSAFVIDERGRSSVEVTETYQVLAYNRPSIPALSVHRCEANGNANDNGDHVRVTFSAEMSAMGNRNTAAYTLRYTILDGVSKAVEVPITALGGRYSVTDYSCPLFAANGDHAVLVEIEARDAVNATVRAANVSTAFTIMNFGADGTSVAIGGVADLPHTLDVKTHQRQGGNHYVLSTTGAEQQAGYVRVAHILVQDAGGDSPLTFELTRRNEIAPMVLHIVLKNESVTSSTVASFTYEGRKYDAILVKQLDQPVYDLYVKKANGEDIITVRRFHMAKDMQDKLAVTFIGDLVGTLPTGQPFTPVPAELHSILALVYPAGMVYFNADGNAPPDFPGGTWQRISSGLDYAAWKRVGEKVVVYATWKKYEAVAIYSEGSPKPSGLSSGYTGSRTVAETATFNVNEGTWTLGPLSNRALEDLYNAGGVFYPAEQEYMEGHMLVSFSVEDRREYSTSGYYTEGAPEAMSRLGHSEYTIYGYTGYTLDETTGRYSTAGSYGSTTAWYDNDMDDFGCGRLGYAVRYGVSDGVLVIYELEATGDSVYFTTSTQGSSYVSTGSAYDYSLMHYSTQAKLETYRIGSYVGDVTDEEGTYPDDGVQGDYYYVKQ